MKGSFRVIYSMKRIIRFWFVLLIGISMSVELTKETRAQTITAGITPSAYQTLRSKLDLNNFDRPTIETDTCPKLRDKTINQSGRITVEIVILCNAIFESGIAKKIEIIHHLPHKRRLKLIADGRIDTSGLTIFPEGLKNIAGKNQPVLSDPVLKIKDFEKAIFTLASRDDVLSIRNLNDLRKFKAVMVKFWQVDMKTLQAMKLKSIIGVLKPDKYVDILKIGRADFTISEFTSATSVAWAKGLVRVPNIKVALLSPRVYPISPKRDDILQALNRFITKYRSGDEDQIRVAFQKSEFISSEFSEWKLIFPTN